MEKIKDAFKDPKIKKRIAALVLSTGISVAPLTACSCAKTDNNITPSPSVSGVINNDSSSQSTSIEDNEYSQYSQILQTVLTDSYYTGLVEKSKSISEREGRSYCLNNNAYMQIPYGFLKQQGYDIALIKNNNVECISNVYTKGDELYIELKVEHKSSIEYYANYLIKYNLTEQELKDLNTLYSGYYPYFQGPQFIQELSYQKTANLISVQYMGKEAQKTAEENILDYLNRAKNIENSDFTDRKQINITLVDIDLTNKVLTFFIHNQQQNVKSFMNIYKSALTLNYINSVKNDEKTIITASVVAPLMSAEQKQSFNNSKFNATFYNSYNYGFTNILETQVLTK